MTVPCFNTYLNQFEYNLAIKDVITSLCQGMTSLFVSVQNELLFKTEKFPNTYKLTNHKDNLCFEGL